MPADCDIEEEKISAYLDGELPESEAERIEEHLGSCSTCQEVHDGLRVVQNVASSASRRSAPDGFLFQVRRKTQQQTNDGESPVGDGNLSSGSPSGQASAESTEEPDNQPGAGSLLKFGSIAAGILLSVLLTGVLVFQGIDSVEKSNEVSQKVAQTETETGESPYEASDQSKAGSTDLNESERGNRILPETRRTQSEKETETADSPEEKEGNRSGARKSVKNEQVIQQKKGVKEKDKKMNKKKTGSASNERLGMTEERKQAKRGFRKGRVDKDNGNELELKKSLPKATCMIALFDEPDRMKNGLVKSLKRIGVTEISIRDRSRKELRTIDLTGEGSEKQMATLVDHLGTVKKNRRNEQEATTAKKNTREEDQKNGEKKQDEETTPILHLTLTLNLNQAKHLLGSMAFQGFHPTVFAPMILRPNLQKHLIQHLSRQTKYTDPEDYYIGFAHPSKKMRKVLSEYRKKREDKPTRTRRRILKTLNLLLAYSRLEMEQNVREAEKRKELAKEGEEPERESQPEENREIESGKNELSEQRASLMSWRIRNFCQRADQYQEGEISVDVPDREAKPEELVRAWIKNLEHIKPETLKRAVSGQVGEKRETERNQEAAKPDRSSRTGILTVLMLRIR